MDFVNNPPHYTSGPVECIEAIEASMPPAAFKGFLKGNVIKYVWRYENKNGAEDLEKAQWYLNRLLAACKAEQDKKEAMEKAVEEVLGAAPTYDPDDYMISGCPDGFCPMPGVRQGPPETLSMFPPVSQ